MFYRKSDRFSLAFKNHFLIKNDIFWLPKVPKMTLFWSFFTLFLKNDICKFTMFLHFLVVFSEKNAFFVNFIFSGFLWPQKTRFFYHPKPIQSTFKNTKTTFFHFLNSQNGQKWQKMGQKWPIFRHFWSFFGIPCFYPWFTVFAINGGVNY